VGCFGVVCSLAFKDLIQRFDKGSQQDSENKVDGRILRRTALLGLWSFVALGILKSVINVVCAMLSVQLPEYAGKIQWFDSTVVTHLNNFFILATILSIVNMYIIGQMSVVEKKVGGANKKFTGTRILVLIGQGQQMACLALTSDSELFKKFILPKINTSWFSGFTELQALLLNSSLLCWECLAVIIFNYFNVFGRDTRGNNNHGLTQSLLPTHSQPSQPVEPPPNTRTMLAPQQPNPRTVMPGQQPPNPRTFIPGGQQFVGNALAR